MHKRWSFPLRISSANLTKSVGKCRFGHIYWRNLYWKTLFFVQCTVKFVFIDCRVKDYWSLVKLICRPIPFVSYQGFLKKQKKRSETRLRASFSALFLKKDNSLLIFYYLTEFYCLVVFTSGDTGQYVHCNCLLAMLWRHKLWN